MIDASAAVLAAYNAGTDQYVHKAVFVLVDGTSFTLTGDRFISAPIYSEDSSSAESFDIGAAIVNEVSFAIRNNDGLYDDYDFDDAVVELYEGLITEEPTEWIRKGIYHVVDAPDELATAISITAQDHMAYLDESVFTTETQITSWPSNALTVVNDILTRHNLVNIASFPNFGVPVAKPEDSDMTDRTMLFYIAQICACVARFSPAGQLQMLQYAVPLSDDEEQRTQITRIYTTSIARQELLVTGVCVTASTGETVTMGTDGYVLEITDNPLITSDLLQSIATQIWAGITALRTYGFKRLDITCHGCPLWQTMDPILVTDSRGNTHRAWITGLQYTTDGQTTVRQAAKSKTKNRASRYSAGTKIKEQAAQETTKQVSTYKTAQDYFNSLSSAMYGMHYSQETDASGGVIQYAHNTPALADSTYAWKMGSTGFFVSTDGGETWSMGFDNEGNAVVNVLNAVGIKAEWLEAGTITGKIVANDLEMRGGKIIVSSTGSDVGHNIIQMSGTLDESSSRSATYMAYVAPTGAVFDYEQTDKSTGSMTDMRFINIRSDGIVMGGKGLSQLSIAPEGITFGGVPLQLVQSGQTAITAAAPGAYTDIAVTFGAAFGSAPRVTASLVVKSTLVEYSQLQMSVHSVSTGGFAVRLYNGSSKSLRPAVAWIATAAS